MEPDYVEDAPMKRPVTQMDKVLDFPSGAGIWVKGTVGYNTAYVWFEGTEGQLTDGKLKRYDLEQLGNWCLAMAKEL